MGAVDAEKDRVRALVTLYYPEKRQIENIRKIAWQADSVYLCDNSPVSHEKDFLNIVNAVYFWFPENRGLSGALNMVLKSDMGWKKNDYVIFFDQDTRIPEFHVIRLLSEYKRLVKKGYRIGCLGPVYYNMHSQMLEIPKEMKYISEATLKVKSIITSSLLCTYQNLKDTGYWNEEIFLDMADWDLCWRFMQKGYLCGMSFVSIIKHCVGEDEIRIGPLKFKTWKPFREYYQIRDGLYLLHKRYMPYRYRLKYISMMILLPLRIAFSDCKRERMRYIKMGVRDYKAGIKGVLYEEYV